MKRDVKIQLLKSLQDGTRPKTEVVKILKGELIEIDNFYDALKITSQAENFEGEIRATGQLKELFETLK